MSYMTITNCHISIICHNHSHMITHHIEECKRPQNDNDIPHINSM